MLFLSDPVSRPPVEFFFLVEQAAWVLLDVSFFLLVEVTCVFFLPLVHEGFNFFLQLVHKASDFFLPLVDEGSDFFLPVADEGCDFSLQIDEGSDFFLQWADEGLPVLADEGVKEEEEEEDLLHDVAEDVVLPATADLVRYVPIVSDEELLVLDVAVSDMQDGAMKFSSRGVVRGTVGGGRRLGLFRRLESRNFWNLFFRNLSLLRAIESTTEGNFGGLESEDMFWFGGGVVKVTLDNVSEVLLYR